MNSPEPRIKLSFFRLGFVAGFIFVLYSQKSQVSLLRYLTFSLVCGRIWQRGAPAGPPAVRVVGACSPVGCVQARPRRQPRQVLLPLPKNRRKHWVFAGFLFSCVALLSGAFWFGFLVSPPSASAAPLSSTRNAPGFAFFWLNRVRFPLFRCFLAAKFSGCFLYTLPYSGYRLKPSVIPCRREVSFLT